MGVECNKDRSSDNAVGYRKIYHNKRTPAARHTSFLFMLASEQVRLAGGKRLEVNTYEMARQSRKAETKDSENEVELKISMQSSLRVGPSSSSNRSHLLPLPFFKTLRFTGRRVCDQIQFPS